MRRVIEAAENDGTEHALCFLDMNQFKVVNDTCCHSGGDELLRQLADLFRKQVRNRDTLARLGGDAFAVLLEHCSIDQAHRAVSGLRKSVFDFESLGRAFQLVRALVSYPSLASTSRKVAELESQCR